MAYEHDKITETMISMFFVVSDFVMKKTISLTHQKIK